MPDINNTIKPESNQSTVMPAPVTNSADSGSVVQAQEPTPPVASAMKQAWNDLDKTDQIKQGSDDLKNAIIGIAGTKPTKQENVDIYAMPKEFQKHNTVAGSSGSLGLIMMSGALLLLLIVGSGAVLYYLKPDLLASMTGMTIKGTEETVTPPVQTVVETPVIAQEPVVTSTLEIATSTEDLMASSTPAKDVYLAYNIELARVNTFADYFNLINKYGSARRVQQIEAEKLLADVTSDKGISTVVNLKKSIPLLDPLAKIVDKVEDKLASLEVALPDNESKGTVDMIWENNAWKLDNENWQLAVKEEAVTYTSGQDRDNDGLSDREEDLFASNKESSDSDADGYSDAVEVAGLYDPNKKSAKLIDSGKFTTYLADDGAYSLIRSSEWSQSKDNNDNSVNFHSKDDHVIKISTILNFDKLSLDELYLKQLGLVQIDSGARMTNDTWTGIMSPDGLRLYLVSKLDTSKYYVLEYKVPANTSVLEYKALLGAMIKSLVIKK
jgi:hypothetical protein